MPIDLRHQIVTNTSVMQLKESDYCYVQFCLSLSVKQADMIKYYFDDIVSGSVYINEKQEKIEGKDGFLTIINIKTTALAHPRFLKQFEELLYVDPDNKLLQYQTESKACVDPSCHSDSEAYTADKIASLNQVKESMRKRNSIFEDHLLSITDKIRPWVTTYTTKGQDTDLGDEKSSGLIQRLQP